MNMDNRWTKWIVACVGAAFASLLWRRRHNETQADRAELHEWENEGGTLVPPPEAIDSRVTTGSA